ESKIWSVDVKEGKPTMLYTGDGVQPQWSPDGNLILFWGLPKGTGKRELWTMPAGGGEPVRLTDDDAIDWSPVWAPDGRGVYYLSNRGGTMNLWLLPIDPGSGKAAGAPELRTLPTQNCTGLRVSRDGKKFIYLSTERRSNIHRAPFDPATLRLTGPSVPVTEGSREFEYLSVSPDMRTLAFTLVGAQEDIGVMGIDGKGFRKLTNDRFKDRGPNWSHDGKKLAFYSERSGMYQIWTVSPDGSGIEQVTFEADGGLIAWPKWMPGDRAIYIQSSDGGGIVDLNAPAGPGRVRRLKPYPGDAFFTGGTLSPDGRQLVGSIDQGDGTGGGLALYSFADSSYRKILDEGSGAGWLADGRTILFIGGGTLKLVDVGSGKVTGLEGLPRFTDYSQFVMAPDNRTLYFSRVEIESDVWEAQAK
ncbi:MAG TPA: hypothetical protein VI932_06980, partial [Bacteroidota bacterium]|nr:hypothetical protein [Bacteroidota bacterium]